MGRDAPDELHLQRRIENAKQELEHMIDLHPQGMFLADEDGIVLRANAGLLGLLDLDGFQDVLERRVDDLFPPVADAPQPRFSARLKQLERSSLASLSWDAETAVPGRAKLPLRFTAVVSRGRSTRYMVLVDDLSTEQAAVRRKEKEDKTRAAEALVGALHHVLNQPLAVIMGRAQLLLFAIEKGPLDPAETRSALEQIVALSRQIADTLAKARKFKDFVTENYVGDVNILNLERSTAVEEKNDAEDPRAD